MRITLFGLFAWEAWILNTEWCSCSACSTLLQDPAVTEIESLRYSVGDRMEGRQNE